MTVSDKDGQTLFDTGTIYELKPNNPNQIKKGTKQLEKYIDEVNREYPQHGPWEGILDTY